MANEEHLRALKKGAKVWNHWREEIFDYREILDLRHADLTGMNLASANLNATNLKGANFSEAYLGGVLFHESYLEDTDFTSADLRGAEFRNAKLINAKLISSYLVQVNFNYADLRGADLSKSTIGFTSFCENDLSVVRGLDTVEHFGPSNIGIDTLYLSRGNISENFLRGAGVPDDFITYVHSLVGKSIEFYSCFISYSHTDEGFARRLYSRMRDAGLRVWFAPEDIKGGEKIHEQLERAIQLYDRLLLVISEHSIQSEWVMTEIRKARKAEIKEKRRKLFPIRLIDYETLRKWECFDADTGKDMAVEVREYFIPDFSNWKDHDLFEVTFEKLLRDLKANMP